jgi:hypothetical protein
MIPWINIKHFVLFALHWFSWSVYSHVWQPAVRRLRPRTTIRGHGDRGASCSSFMDMARWSQLSSLVDVPSEGCGTRPAGHVFLSISKHMWANPIGHLPRQGSPIPLPHPRHLLHVIPPRLLRDATHSLNTSTMQMIGLSVILRPHLGWIRVAPAPTLAK